MNNIDENRKEYFVNPTSTDSNIEKKEVTKETDDDATQYLEINFKEIVPRKAYSKVIGYVKEQD